MLEPLNGSDLVHVVEVSGTLYMLPTAKPLLEWNTIDLIETKNLLGVAVLPHLQRYALTRDGQVILIEGSRQRKNVEIIEGLRFQKLMGPYYWSPSLKEL